jgi:hypothetical protein
MGDFSLRYPMMMNSTVYGDKGLIHNTFFYSLGYVGTKGSFSFEYVLNGYISHSLLGTWGQ